MNGTRKAGLVLAGLATALWLGALAAVLRPRPDDGVAIGGALLALLAVPVSAGASITLLASLRGGWRSAPAILRAAARLAVVALVALTAFLLIDPYGGSGPAQFAVLGLGVLAFLASTALFAAAGRPPGRQPQPGR